VLTLCALCVATVYAGPYVGQERYCGGTYDADDPAPWVALPVSWYEEGRAECGDLIYLSGVDAEGAPWSLMARALDAGPLERYCVETGEGCARIVADVPAHQAPFGGMSARVWQVRNVSAAVRAHLN